MNLSSRVQYLYSDTHHFEFIAELDARNILLLPEHPFPRSEGFVSFLYPSSLLLGGYSFYLIQSEKEPNPNHTSYSSYL